MEEPDMRLKSLTGAFALCPQQLYMAVGGRSHIHLLRVYGEDGQTTPGTTLKADCSVRAAGVRSLAWSSHGSESHPEAQGSAPCIESDVYEVGLLAAGFGDGVVSIWEPPMERDSEEFVEEYELKLMDDAEEKKMRESVREILTKLDSITKDKFKSKVQSMTKVVLQDKNAVGLDNWDLLEDGVETWVHHKGNSKAIGAELGALLKMKNLEGPVLGLSFNHLHPNWLATAANGEKIVICNLCYSIDSSSALELSDVGSKKVAAQMTCLDWNRFYPHMLASTNDAGISKVWDVRRPGSASILDQGVKMCSDIKWSPYDHMHFAVATKDAGSSPSVKIWDLRQVKGTFYEYDTKGVVSLSWGLGGRLLSSHNDGTVTCAFPYDGQDLRHLTSSHGDLGVTWCHYDDTYVTLSSKDGIQINQTDRIPRRSLWGGNVN